VDVDVVSDSVSGVVAVPVSALVALSEGGYAVEVQQNDGSTVLVAVEPGFYADGLVEVTETQVTPGMLVVVP
jgi:multidrug efflux pump subunit AcrA (membrane-fusion protein)